MNHVFTCVGCSRQWDVISNAPLDCFFSGLCCDCIQRARISQEQISSALTPLLASESHVNVTSSENLFDDPLLYVSPESLERKATTNGAAVTELAGQIQDLFDYWKDVCKHPNATLDKKRSRAISKQLINGRTFNEIKLAIRGASLDPFLLAKKEQEGIAYDDIELICRDAKHIERYIGIARKVDQEEIRWMDPAAGTEEYRDILERIRRNRR